MCDQKALIYSLLRPDHVRFQGFDVLFDVIGSRDGCTQMTAIHHMLNREMSLHLLLTP